MNINRVMLLVMLMLGCSWAMSAQGFYDDDIYYNPSKAKKTAKKRRQQQSVQPCMTIRRPISIPLTTHQIAMLMSTTVEERMLRPTPWHLIH